MRGGSWLRQLYFLQAQSRLDAFDWTYQAGGRDYIPSRRGSLFIISPKQFLERSVIAGATLPIQPEATRAALYERLKFILNFPVIRKDRWLYSFTHGFGETIEPVFAVR